MLRLGPAADFHYVIDQAGVFPDDQPQACVFAFWKRAGLDVPLLLQTKPSTHRLDEPAAPR